MAAVIVLGAVVQPRGGPLGLANLLAAHIAISGFVFLPVLLLTRSRALAIAFAVLILTVGIRFGDEWISVKGPPRADAALRVATWNLEFGAVGIAAGIDGLRALDGVDLVALQELTLEQAAAIEADPGLIAAYPERALFPAPGTGGIGLLAVRSLSDVEWFSDPVGMRSVLDVDGVQVIVHTAHPLPASIGTVTGLRLPIAYDPTTRDIDLTRIRERMVGDLRTNQPVLLLGDFNVAPTEPAYDTLAMGLDDAHRAVGFGTGWSWRPSRFESLGVGLLRIDHVFSRGLDALSIDTDCSRPGDHCVVTAAFGVP